MTTKIFLADDHQLVRQGLRMLLESESDFKVIGEAGDGLEVLSKIFHLVPDVLVVDVVMPNLNGIEVVREVKARLPEVKAVIISMHEIPAYVSEALQAGASAYVLKKATAENLVRAIRSAMSGEIYLSLPLNQTNLQSYAARSTEAYDVEKLYGRLTERERQTLQMAAEGLSNPEIAARLKLSARTVEMYRASLLKKLKIRNQTELVRYAIKRGLIE